MAENNIGQRRPRPVPPPRNRPQRNDPPNDELYEEVEFHNRPEFAFQTGQSSQDGHPSQSHSGPSFQSDQASIYADAPESELYATASEYEGSLNEEYGYEEDRRGGEFNMRREGYENEYLDLNQARREVQHSYDYCSNDYQRTISNDIFKKIHRFKSRPKEFIDGFESTKDEIRTDEETFIIVHLLTNGNSQSPTLGGSLDKVAMLACCSSPHVVKRALDALLNEIFLSISDSSRIRCHNILEAEEVLRSSFLGFLKVDNLKAKCHRMTTYAWLITLVLLQCTKDDREFIEIQPRIKEFDKILDALQNDKEHSRRNSFRYGIYLARESIKRIGKKYSSESLKRNIKKCENILNGKLEKDEVMNLGKALSDGGSWLDLHVCLVFLQDLPKLYQFHDDKKPVILIQMLVADYRERCGANKVKNLLKIPNYEWQFEILVYHLMLRLIRTSRSKAFEQVLAGEQGCGGILKSTIYNKSKPTKDEQLVLMHLKKLCQRTVFVATPNIFNQFITDNCSGDEKRFIETLSILHISATYKDKVLEILPESRLRIGQHRVNTYDALMSGRKCLLKLHQHSKEDVLRTDALKTVPLRKEIEILKILSAVAEPSRNIIQLLGSSIEAPMHMIIERTPKTDLLTFLQDLSNPPETSVLLQISLDICNAMIYLGVHKIIHRDLRAKNCSIFMHEGNLLTKLGDFHLAILSYSGPKPPIFSEYFPKQFAVRWMAIEALQFGEFSPASDVWSFGVLLSEIFTFGCKPYTNMPSGLSLDLDEEVREFVLTDNRLEPHPKIPKSIRMLIELTMMDVDHRPTFSDLIDNLMNMKIFFEDGLYTDPAHYRILHGNVSDTSRQPINPRTGCNVQGCFGECLNASDIAITLSVDGVHRVHSIKEFVSASPDILKLAELEHPSLAAIIDKIVHVEKVELITKVGDFGSLEEFISVFGCPMENAMTYLSQIGDAISYLHDRRFIHRNLRAASVFIFSSGNAKLACFARVRKLKPNPDGQSSTMPINLPMPSDDSLRWSSPEIIIDGKYSKASDVWALAVLIWEMFTLIDKEDLNEGDDEISHLPYHHLTSKEQILSYLEKKKRLGQPKNCPEPLYEMMVQCWEYNAEDRLTCQDIVHVINNQIPSTTTEQQDQYE